MSVTKVERKPWRGRGAGYQIDIAGNNQSTINRNVVEIFQITTDNGNDSGPVILQDPCVPQALQPHPDWPLCLMTGIQTLQDSNNAINWFATATYTSLAPRQADDNLLDAPDIVRWNGEPVQHVVDRADDGGVEDVNGNVLKEATGKHYFIANRAGDQFDPPVMDESYDLIVTVTRNVAYVPLWVIEYSSFPASVNDAPLVLGGVPMEIATLLMRPPSISELKQQNNVFYYEMSMTFAYRIRGWDWRIPNLGTKCIRNDGQKSECTNRGVQVSSPQMLDEDGKQIFTNHPDDATICVYLRPRDDFSVIRLPVR